MRPPIFLDWDGVLIDSLDLYLDLFRSLCKEHNKVLPIDDATGFRNWYEPNWELNFSEMGFTNQQYADICESYPQTLDYGRAELFSDVPELVNDLSQHHDVVVVSTAPTENIKTRLHQADLLKHFHAVTGSDDGDTHKTKRLQNLCRELDSKVGVMVGDTDLDVKSGREAGLLTIGVSYGWQNSRRLSAAEPDYMVDSPAELRAALSSAVESITSQS